jgi:hypothetical protein
MWQEQHEGIMSESIATPEQTEKSLIDLAVESWKFSRLFARVLSKLDPAESTRYANQLRYFQKRVDENLDSASFKIVNLENEPYDPGMAVSAINIGDFDADDVLIVDQMVEPIIMSAAGLKKEGVAILRKVQ